MSIFFRILPLALLASACATDSDYTTMRGWEPEYKDFLAADTDNSGKLSRAETEAAFPPVAKKFQRYDADGDGLIAWNELKRVDRFDDDRRARFEPAQPR